MPSPRADLAAKPQSSDALTLAHMRRNFAEDGKLRLKQIIPVSTPMRCASASIVGWRRVGYWPTLIARCIAA
jgi:hypothetical protein